MGGYLHICKEDDRKFVWNGMGDVMPKDGFHEKTINIKIYITNIKRTPNRSI